LKIEPQGLAAEYNLGYSDSAHIPWVGVRLEDQAPQENAISQNVNDSWSSITMDPQPELGVTSSHDGWKAKSSPWVGLPGYETGHPSNTATNAVRAAVLVASTPGRVGSDEESVVTAAQLGAERFEVAERDTRDKRSCYQEQ
jgi:hypothetical protein